jgi:D-alanyl-D-alanine carboxypeptidase/D-alanyl-D-alanine-endopeptidase (penicillin-binding protein 4)
MDDRDRSHSAPGRVLRRTTGAVVVLLLAGGAAAYRFDLGERLGIAVPDAGPNPAAVAPPSGLVLPSAPVAPAVAALSEVRPADPVEVSRAVSRLVRAKRLGRQVSVSVGQPDTAAPVFSYGSPMVTPASTMKLLTSLAVLQVLGPDHRFSTTVVRSGKRIVLVGGGDPLLARRPGTTEDYPQRADLATLAGQTAKSLKAAGVTRVRLGYDASLFTGPAVDPTWEPDYIPDDVVSPIVPLWVDEGRERDGYTRRSKDPSLAAARAFAASLAKRGITVAGAPVARLAPTAMTQVASVSSPPLSEIVQHTLEVSDNEAAEVLARQVAVAQGGEASFEGAAAAVESVLRGLGVTLSRAVIHDGSGLSRSDRLPIRAFLDVLRVASADPRLRTVVSGLPVAGYTGSLASRFESAPRIALGEVRAKTGTLTGVNGLAGTVVTRDGVLLSFVAIADKVKPDDTLFARAQLDRIAGALAACTCG